MNTVRLGMRSVGTVEVVLGVWELSIADGLAAQSLMGELGHLGGRDSTV